MLKESDSAVQDGVAKPRRPRLGVSAEEVVTRKPKSLRSAILWTALVLVAFLGGDTFLATAAIVASVPVSGDR